jgi:uncharacterized repeat protein (TIGR03803 family)
MNSLYRKTKVKSHSVASATLFALVALFVATTVPVQAQTVNTLYSFSSNSSTQPIMPYGNMAQGRDGAFYGISQSGNGCCQGWFYKTTSAGVLTPLHALAQSEGTNCNGLTLGTDGNFYGTCYAGGTYSFGTLFKVTPSGTLTVLHSFSGVADGCDPLAPPIQAADGNFYGTTYFCGGTDLGSVYRYTPAGAYKILYNFQGPPSDLQNPHGLIQGSDGNLWGMGDQGGAQNSTCPGCGGVFKLTLAGKETIVYTFKGGTDGQDPYTSLIQGSDGSYYGVTEGSGGSNLGTVFKLTPAGVETVLRNYSDQTQGAFPRLPLTQGPDGLLYGIATDCAGGGCSQAGLFDITTKGVYSNLYLYPIIGGNNNSLPYSPLLLSTNGTFYSTTEGGGINGAGSFYSLSTKYSPFISLVNVRSGKVGTQVGILGQGFTSSSVVKFGGTAAATTALTGSTFILATVPTGALTGKVTVTIGSTTLSTSSTYKVTPTVSGFSPASGPVGTSVTITGTGLTQTTKVTFNKVVASFTVKSDSQITAVVPTGATTGKIVVTTKGGGATSSTSFTVN